MTVPISRFAIVPLGNRKRLVAELSAFKSEDLIQPLYPDKPGMPQRDGVTVRGKTGAEVSYYIANVIRNEQEDELEGFLLLPTRESLAAVPGARNTEMFLVND